MILLASLFAPCAALNAVPSQSSASCSRASMDVFRVLMLAVLVAILVVLVATFALVAFSCAPLTASVLFSDKVPALTLVIVLAVSVPCAALYAVPFQSIASCSRVSIDVLRVLILAVLVAMLAVLLAILVVLVATLSLVAFSCEPLTASVLSSERVPAFTLVMVLVVSVP